MEDIEFFERIDSEHYKTLGGDFSMTNGVAMDEPRLVVTSEQLLQIKLYVEKGRTLPIERGEIETHLGGIIDLPDFQWTEIQDLNQKIKDHADTWSPIESGLILVGGSLSGFAANLVGFSNGLIKNIEDMPIVKRVEAFEGVDLESLPFIPFDQSDVAVHDELVKVFKDLKESVLLARKSTDDLKVKIDRFHRELSDKLIPLVGDKISKLGAIDFAMDLVRFREEIGVIERDIGQTNKELIKHGSMSAAGNLDAIALTLKMIFSSPEEAVFGKAFLETQEKLKRLQKDKQRLIGKIDGQEKLPGLILSHSTSLDNVSGFMRAAATASAALVRVWDSVLAEIDKSASELWLIKDGVSLIRFQQSFKRGIAPWNEVKELADELLKALKKAIKDFDKRQVVRQAEGRV